MFVGEEHQSKTSSNDENATPHLTLVFVSYINLGEGVDLLSKEGWCFSSSASIIISHMPAVRPYISIFNKSVSIALCCILPPSTHLHLCQEKKTANFHSVSTVVFLMHLLKYEFNKQVGGNACIGAFCHFQFGLSSFFNKSLLCVVHTCFLRFFFQDLHWAYCSVWAGCVVWFSF